MMVQEVQVRAVLADWQKCPDVVALGTKGMMSRVEGKGDITRRDVCLNVDAVAPIVMHFGALRGIISDPIR